MKLDTSAASGCLRRFFFYGISASDFPLMIHFNYSAATETPVALRLLSITDGCYP